MEQITSGLTITATSGTLTNVAIAPYYNTSILSYATIYNVTFKSALELATTNSI